MKPPAAIWTVCSGAPKDEPCPTCGRPMEMRYGSVYDHEPLVCAECFDDRSYKDCSPDVRAAAEARRDAALEWADVWAREAIEAARKGDVR